MKKYNQGLFCFSPPVMLATFIIEIALAIGVLWRYKLNEVGQLAVVILVFLAIFQLAEFNVCADGWLDPTLGSRIGYVAITLLPALGVHLAYAIAGTERRPLLFWAYVTAASYAVFFTFVPNALVGHVCTGNYAIFQMAPLSGWLYGFYYNGWIFIGMILAWKLATQNAQVAKALYGLLVGYLVFLIPTGVVVVLDPSTIDAIPSIMCGFAVMYALILALWILPHSGTKRHKLAA